MFYKKGILKKFVKSIGEHLCLRSATLLKKRLWHRCFPVNFAKFLRKQTTTTLNGKLNFSGVILESLKLIVISKLNEKLHVVTNKKLFLIRISTLTSMGLENTEDAVKKRKYSQVKCTVQTSTHKKAQSFD